MGERAEQRPILCRTLSPEVSQTIDVFVAAGIYRSRDQGLADLAAIGLRAKLERQPSLTEVISLAEQLQQVGKAARASFLPPVSS